MSIGNGIIANANPKGTFLEGFISGTDKPGVVMQIKAATEPVGGRLTWEAFNRTGTAKDGLPTLVAVLLPDDLRGKLTTDAYTTGTRCFLYCPIPGEEMNMIIADISGTADDYAIGDLLQVIDGSGKLEDFVTGTAFNYHNPFVLCETITDPSADYLAHTMFTGY
jgi:hypothetical protein